MANGTNTRCGAYYKVKQGDTCDKITTNAVPPISFDDFLFLNPSVNKGCSNLIPGENYCLEAVGDINTYPGYGLQITGSCTGPGSPSTCYGNWSTLSPRPFGNLASSTPVASSRSSLRQSSSNSVISVPQYTPSATASGTWPPAECNRYAEFVDTGDEETNSLVDSCSYMAESYSTTIEDLKKWNPSLQDADPWAFSRGRRYCVEAKTNGTGTSSEASAAPSTAPDDTTTPTVITTRMTQASSMTTGITTPTPTQSGMAVNCDKFYKVVKDDGCYAIATSHGITPDQFYEYNPAVKRDCSGLWPDYYVCVGVNGS